MRIHEDDDERDEDRELELEGAPQLPDRELLAAWTVPEPAIDLAERVMEHVEAGLPASETSEEGATSMEDRRRGGYGWALVGVAMVAAAALVLGLSQLWRSEPRVTAPVVVTVPVAVPVASPPASHAPSELPPAPGTPVQTPPSQAEPASEPPETTAEAPKSPKATSKAPRAGRGSKDPFAPKVDEAKTATLRIGTGRGYGPAKVYIDGRYVGMTPIMNVKVAPGRHTVKFAWSDGGSETSSFTVEDGQTRTLKGPMKALEDPYSPE
ncbi:PEGA domain-containing protein [Paraliomyxa miuraensis]|uniref:PEGA domain-containing protein n=1 Tax=Paraliomyxa miuraensis TaxID=376150 RepID=UPI0022512FB1|nr:PEGA domain-containing protein [Paraliomyxa miuraensis]MCX4245761.1 PEGA domain-containing protein [Paraliomyxa miuraensis]